MQMSNDENVFGFKEKLHQNIVGTHISMTNSMVSEILGHLGYDYIWIDSEHSENNYTSIRNHITAVNAGGTPAIVRVSQNDFNHVKRILEMGVQGIVFPMVNGVKEAENAVRFSTYPPRGIRGFGPLRAVNYGIDDISEYIRTADSNLCRFIQIESVQAVDNLEEIVKIDMIDGFIFGPYDLSGSLGELGNIYGEKIQSCIRKAIEILKKHGKTIGISLGTTDVKELMFWKELGINMISSGTDYDYIMQGARENLRNFREYIYQ